MEKLIYSRARLPDNPFPGIVNTLETWWVASFCHMFGICHLGHEIRTQNGGWWMMKVWDLPCDTLFWTLKGRSSREFPQHGEKVFPKSENIIYMCIVEYIFYTYCIYSSFGRESHHKGRIRGLVLEGGHNLTSTWDFTGTCRDPLFMYVCMCIYMLYIYTYIHIYIYICFIYIYIYVLYIYIYMCYIYMFYIYMLYIYICVCVYLYIYICIHWV